VKFVLIFLAFLLYGCTTTSNSPKYSKKTLSALEKFDSYTGYKAFALAKISRNRDAYGYSHGYQNLARAIERALEECVSQLRKIDITATCKIIKHEEKELITTPASDLNKLSSAELSNIRITEIKTIDGSDYKNFSLDINFHYEIQNFSSEAESYFCSVKLLLNDSTIASKGVIPNCLITKSSGDLSFNWITPLDVTSGYDDKEMLSLAFPLRYTLVIHQGVINGSSIIIGRSKFYELDAGTNEREPSEREIALDELTIPSINIELPKVTLQ